MGSGPNRGQILVEWGDFPSVYLSKTWLAGSEVRLALRICWLAERPDMLVGGLAGWLVAWLGGLAGWVGGLAGWLG